jgi:hypothetical protein
MASREDESSLYEASCDEGMSNEQISPRIRVARLHREELTAKEADIGAITYKAERLWPFA